MTIFDAIPATLLILAIAVNSTSVYLQKTRNIYKRFGSNALKVHTGIITSVWVAFVLSTALIFRSSWRFAQSYPGIGTLMIAIGLYIFISAYKQIGNDGLINANFFGAKQKDLKGIYTKLQHPMYVAYVFWLVGMATFTGRAGFMLLSVIAAFGLLVVEARIEKT